MSNDEEITRGELESLLRFAHSQSMRTGHAADRVETLLTALLEALLEKGASTRTAFDTALAEVRSRAARDGGPPR